MARSLTRAAFVAVVVLGGAMTARAEGSGTEVDLTTFGREPAPPASVWDDLPLEDVARRLGTAPRGSPSRA